MNWLDLLLVAVFLLHLFSGLSRGLVKQLFDIFGFFVVIILAFLGSRVLSESLAEYINPEDIIPHHEVIQSLGLEVAFEKAPQFIAGIIAFLGLFLVLSLLFRLFANSFRWVNRIPVIGFINRVSGALVGILIGAVFVYVIIAAVALVPLQFFMEAIENSEVVFFVDHYFTTLAEEIVDWTLNFYLSLNN